MTKKLVRPTPTALTPLETYTILEHARVRVARLSYCNPAAQAEAVAFEDELYMAEEHLLDNLYIEKP